MSFCDELQKSIKTPEQIRVEQESAAPKLAREHARKDFESIKRAITEEASNGR